MSRLAGRSGAKRAGTIGLVVLVILNVVLLLFALGTRPSRGVASADRVDAGDASPGSPSTAAAGPTSPGEQTAPSAQANPDSPPKPLLLLVSAVDGRTAWRARTGTCDERARVATVESSQDGGRTWVDVGLSASAVTRIAATSARRAFVVAAPRDARTCALSFRSTNGAAWSAPSDPGRAWYRFVTDERRIGIPGSKSARPCGGSAAVVDLVADGARRAAVLCTDARVVTTSDGGVTWRLLDTIRGAVALSGRPGGSGYLAAALGLSGCDGVAVLPVGTRRPTDCISGLADPARPGLVAISAAAGATWLLVGQSVYVSDQSATGFRRRDG